MIILPGLRSTRRVSICFTLSITATRQLILDLPRERAVVTCHDLDTFKCLLEPDSEPRPRWFRAMAQRTLDGFMQSGACHLRERFHARESAAAWAFLSRTRHRHHAGSGSDLFLLRKFRPAGERNGGHRDQTYLLHVGSTIRRKRIDVLLRVFARVVAEISKPSN